MKYLARVKNWFDKDDLVLFFTECRDYVEKRALGAKGHCQGSEMGCQGSGMACQGVGVRSQGWDAKGQGWHVKGRCQVPGVRPPPQPPY